MPELKNIRRERFCLLYALLGNATEAYRQAGYKDIKHADVSGCRLLSFASVKARVQEIKTLSAPKTVRNRDGIIEWLDDMMSRPAEEPVKWSDKLRAAEILVRMCGFNAPEQLELGISNKLTQYLSDLRSEREVKAIEIETERQLDEPPLP